MSPKRTGSQATGDYAAHLIERLRWRMGHDYDNVLLIDGPEGTGKSTLALHLLDKLDAAWRAETNILYDWGDLATARALDESGRTIVLDEGSNLLYSRDHGKVANRRFTQLLFQCRQQNNTLIVCIPNRRWVDSTLREHRVEYMLHTYARGRALVSKRSQNAFTGEVKYRAVGSLRYAKFTGAKWADYKRLKTAAYGRFRDGMRPSPAQEEAISKRRPAFTPRQLGTNPRALGSSPRVRGAGSRAAGTNPRAQGQNPRALGTNRDHPHRRRSRKGE